MLKSPITSFQLYVLQLVSARDNIECMSLKEIEGAESAMLRGLLAGILSGYWKTDVYRIRPEETKSIARGDPYCQLEYRKEKYEPLV